MQFQDWTDFWQRAGSHQTTKFTWDTLDHGSSFNRFYGDNADRYHARYDRVYFHNGDGKGPMPPNQFNVDVKLNVCTFELFADTPVTTKRTHFLSDHFGIATTFELTWPE